MLLLIIDVITAWAAVVGICLCILGLGRSWVEFLVAPAMVRWVIIPVLPIVGRAVLSVVAAHWVWLLPLLLVAPLILVRLFAGFFESALCLLLGPHVGARAAGHVAGVMGIRLTDWLFGRRRGRPIPEFEEEEEE